MSKTIASDLQIGLSNHYFSATSVLFTLSLKKKNNLVCVGHKLPVTENCKSLSYFHKEVLGSP